MIDADLWEQFQSVRLPAADWTHVSHVRIAWIFMRRYDLDEAHLRARAGIIRLNASHGLVETPARGYHDTVTRAWLVLVRAAMKRSPGFEDSALFLAAHAGTLGKIALLRHYSKERLASVEARARFIDPDLVPLP